MIFDFPRAKDATRRALMLWLFDPGIVMQELSLMRANLANLRNFLKKWHKKVNEIVLFCIKEYEEKQHRKAEALSSPSFFARKN